MTDRVALLRRGARLESVTVAYNALEGGVAIVAGLAAGSDLLRDLTLNRTAGLELDNRIVSLEGIAATPRGRSRRQSGEFV